MEVEIETAPSRSARFVLKLYDFRYSTQLRDDYKTASFGLAQEIAYFNFVKSGEARAFRTKFLQDEDFDELAENKLTGAQKEVFLHTLCLQTFGHECEAYDRLNDLQGQDIPRLIAEVRLPTSFSSTEETLGEFYEMKGILLELVDGFTLHELPDRAPREDWQKVCDQAVRVVQMCDEREIFNMDVRPANFLISPLPSKNTYRVVMLDFGQCRTRSPEESDREWGQAKWTENEEGKIGSAMQRRLERFGFDLIYKSSGKFDQLAHAE